MAGGAAGGPTCIGDGIITTEGDLACAALDAGPSVEGVALVVEGAGTGKGTGGAATTGRLTLAAGVDTGGAAAYRLAAGEVSSSGAFRLPVSDNGEVVGSIAFGAASAAGGGRAGGGW